MLPLIEDLGMHPEDGGDVDSEGAVHVDRDLGDLPRAPELVEAVDQLLGAPERERGDQHLAPARRHPAHRFTQALLGVGHRLVLPVGVGGLDDEGVDRSGRRLRVADDGEPAPADVAGEHQPVAPGLGDPDVHAGRSQDVAGVHELEREMFPEVGDAPIGYAHHQLLGRDGVGQGVERLALRVRLAAALEKLEILLLDVRRVGQHDGAEVPGRGRGVDRSVEAVAHQQREPARVVDVGVAQHDAVEAPGIEGEPGVELPRLRPVPLEQPGVEQESPARRLEQVHGAGDLARAAVEGKTDHWSPRLSDN